MLKSKRITGRAAAGAMATALVAGSLWNVAANQAAAAPEPTYPSVTVNANGGLNLRITPSTFAESKVSVENGLKIEVKCQTNGTRVDGNQRWYKVAPGGPGAFAGEDAYMPARYVNGRPKLPTCGKSNKLLTVTATKQTTNIRQGPTHKDARLRTVPRGSKLQVSCFVGGDRLGKGRPGSPVYYRVKGGTGWIAGSDAKDMVNNQKPGACA